MTRQRNETRVQKYKQWVEHNRIIAAIIFGSMIIIGLGTVLVNIREIRDVVTPASKPDLEVFFIDKRGPKSELNIAPTWPDSGVAGLSAPVPITIGLRNRGNAPATNVKVHLVYPPVILAFQKGSGESVTPAVLADVLTISGDEVAQSFTIDRVDVSDIFDAFERDLHLRLRFRERLGVPVYKSRTLTVIPLVLDFTNPRAGELGTFPVDYTVSYSESSDDKKGTIYLRIDESKMEEIRTSQLGPDAMMGLVGEKTDLKLEHVLESEERTIPFVKGDLPLAVGILLGSEASTPDKFIHAIVTENTSEHDMWHEIRAEGESPVVVLDRGKDGSLDEMYVNAGGGEEWIHVKPDREVYFVPLSNIVDFEADAGMAAVIAAFKKSFGMSD